MKLTKKARVQLILAGIFFTLLSAVSTSFVFLTQRAVDYTVAGNLRGMLIIQGIAIVIFVPFDFLLAYVSNKCGTGFVREMLVTVKHFRLNFIFKRRTKSPATGETQDLSFFTADADILSNSYLAHRARLPAFISQFAFAVIAMLFINWVVAIAAMVLSLLPMLVSKLFAKKLANRKLAYSNAAAEYVETVKECINGKKEIVAYDKQSLFLKRHRIKNEKVENARQSSTMIEQIAFRASVGSGMLMQVGVITLSAYFVISGDLTIGYMMAMLQLMHSLLNPIYQTVGAVNGMRSAKAVLDKAGEAPKPEPTDKNISITSFSDTLTVTNLGIKYTDDEYVVKDLNLNFKKGGKYAICAPSGYGKSSIARALALEFSEFEGSITIDGQDIRQIETTDYHALLRYVSQSPNLFNDTVINNIAFFDSIPTKSKLDNVLQVTRVNEFMPNDEALNRQISDTSGLSGGQKQRIVLARALLHNPKILVLDEITSGVDLETSCNILSALFADKDLTCIVITHENDENFQKLFDEVIYLDKGTVNVV